MRSFVALGIVLALLVALTVTVAPRRHHRRPPPVPVEQDEEASPAVPATPPPSPETRRPPPPAVRSSAPAHLFGQVVAPAGEAVELDDGLEVTADDGTRTISARVSDDGHFDLHVPPGQYTVEAAIGSWIGLAAGVAARAGGERELTIALGPAVALSGTLRAPAGASVTVRVSLAGRTDWETGTVGDDGAFEVSGLSPGRAYDLSFSGPEVRTTTLRSLTAPAADLRARVDALPLLRGAIGFPLGAHCPIAHVGIYPAGTVPPSDEDFDDGDDDDERVRVSRVGGVDTGCRFQLVVPEGASQMTVIAVGDGWHLELPVSLPPIGDPEPICLNPPCRANPMEGLSTLRISLSGAPPEGGIHATAVQATHPLPTLSGCGGNIPRCAIADLDSGWPVTLKVGNDDCLQQTRTIVPTDGDNVVDVPCERPPNGEIISEAHSDR
jgi:hypothetical protein